MSIDPHDPERWLRECRELLGRKLADAVRIAVEAEREECARLVSAASVTSPSPIDGLGGLTLAEMNETAQTAIHGACQSLAFAIRERGCK